MRWPVISAAPRAVYRHVLTVPDLHKAEGLQGVAISQEGVSGRIAGLHIVRNQTVGRKKGHTVFADQEGETLSPLRHDHLDTTSGILDKPSRYQTQICDIGLTERGEQQSAAVTAHSSKRELYAILLGQFQNGISSSRSAAGLGRPPPPPAPEPPREVPPRLPPPP